MTLLPNSLEGKAEPFLKRIENILKAIESRKGEYMAEVKEYREDIASIYTEAKDKGVSPKALKGLVKYRELERRQQTLGDGLDISDASDFETLVAALGDFGDSPLGKAALDKAEQQSNRRGRKGATAAPTNGSAPDADTVKARTAAELSESDERIDKTFAERMAEQNAVVDEQIKSGAEAAPAFAG